MFGKQSPVHRVNKQLRQLGNIGSFVNHDLSALGQQGLKHDVRCSIRCEVTVFCQFQLFTQVNDQVIIQFREFTVSCIHVSFADQLTDCGLCHGHNIRAAKIFSHICTTFLFDPGSTAQHCPAHAAGYSGTVTDAVRIQTCGNGLHVCMYSIHPCTHTIQYVIMHKLFRAFYYSSFCTNGNNTECKCVLYCTSFHMHKRVTIVNRNAGEL